jgi:peptidoglycan hydrolase-like protein with peptidoglycan-binding domain
MAQLKRGMSGSEVRALQQGLNDAGADPPLAVDGVFGPRTETAVKAYQTENDLDVSGVAPNALQRILSGTTAPAVSGTTAASSGTGGPPPVTFESSDAVVAAGNQKGASKLLLPGNAGLWYNTSTKQWFVVYKVPKAKGQETPVYTSWLIETDNDLEALVGPDKTAAPNWEGTTAQMTAIGVVNFGGSDEMRRFDNIEGDPFDTWVEDYATLAAVRPWILEPDWIELSVQAAMEREDGQVSLEEIQSTNWWKDHTVAERTWMETENGDPAEAIRLMEDNRTKFKNQLNDAGVTNVTDAMVNFMADKVTTGTWSVEKLTGQVAAISDPWSVDTVDSELLEYMAAKDFDPMQTREGEEDVRELLKEWLGPVYGQWSEKDIAEAAGVMRNDPASGETNLIERLKDQRLAAYGNYADRNLSYESIARPWRTVTESVWGEPVDDTDETFQKVLRDNDADESAKLLRKTGFDRGYDRVVNKVSDGLSSATAKNVRGAV